VLLRHPFIKRAKKTAFLQELIDKYKKWKVQHGNDSDSSSGDSDL
jgi:serine/threonine-protein kinase 24/25/MST4